MWLRRAGRILKTGALAATLSAAACPDEPVGDVTPGERPFLMGFSGFPPKPDLPVAVAALQMWASRADAAIFHVELPWKLLLSGGDVAGHIRQESVGLADFFRSKGFVLFVTFDFTDGLGREREARELRELGRSIAEPSVQQAARSFVRAWVQTIRPAYVGLGAETNLVRLAAPRATYDGLRTLANAAAADVRSTLPSAVLYATLQADVAWGRLQKTNVWIGVDEDFRDFPFMQAVGVSAYPYLAGFEQPEQIPRDYVSRLTMGRTQRPFVAEGGWSSANVSLASSSPAKQSAYVRRMAEVLTEAQALAWLQLQFTDIDASAFPVPPGYESMLALFTRLGLVDSELRAKPALAEWDAVFRRRRE